MPVTASVGSVAPTIEDLLPDYEVGQELGRGAMGIVYLGKHRHLGREVAIKKLPVGLLEDSEVRARFLTEARTLARLDHPNIVPIYDFVDRDGHCLLVMEALRGGTLWERFTSDGLTLQSSVAVAIATAEGVHHAHTNEVLHRDIKPENLMFAGPGQIKVTDFGIAKVVNGAQTMATMDGTILGTPAYMAPEQAGGEKIGPAADVYAIGAVLFELLCGRLPFEGDSPMTLLVQRLMEDAPDVKTFAPDIPASIAEVVARCLVRDQSDRLRSGAELSRSLHVAAEAEWGHDWASSTGIDLGPLRGTSESIEEPKLPSPGSAPATIRPLSSAAPAPAAPETVAPLGYQAPAVVRPLSVHTPREPLDSRGKLVDVASLIKPPGRVWPLVTAALVSTVLAVLAVWSAPKEANLLSQQTGRAELLVNGLPLEELTAQSENETVVSLALDESFTLGGIGEDLVSVKVDYSGIEVWSDEAQAGIPEREIDLGSMGYALTGPLTLTLDRPESLSVFSSFAIRSTRPWYMSAQGPVLIMVLVACLSMLEFRLRSFRKGDVRIIRLIGSAATAAVLAATAAIGYGQYTSQIVTLDALARVALIGAVAASLVALARARTAKARRRRRAIALNTSSTS